ncbi:MAG: hypothetical protein C0592_13605 [Marinilabiliales bacterium]|nr:MAG: hypothetical protein C0592_13605 [Marinilabiliales bacterium]
MRILFCILISIASLSVNATTYTVTNTNTSGAGSLYEAINTANFAPGGPHTIVFNIPTSDGGYNSTEGIWVINFTPATKLPYILGSNISINGSTQTTYAGDLNPYGPEIVLDGGGNTDFCFFVMSASNIDIIGFNIREFTYGIQISGSTAQNCVIQGNYIGTNHTGTDTMGCYIGVEILNSASYTQIGGTATTERNIISGNEHIGLRLLNSSHNTIVNNYIGVDRTGTLPVRNYDGLSLEAYTQHNQIGGDDPSERNIISGNVAYGLPLIGADTKYNIIQGNYIGCDVTGTQAIPNTYGILFDDGSNHNTVGGKNNGEGNILSGNSGYGLFIYNNGTTKNDIFGNLIGTDYTGTQAVPNGNGVVIDGIATDHLLDSNLISGNIQHGIVIHITGTDKHKITRNLIGTDITGLNPLPNGGDGVRVAEGGRDNIIGIAPDSGNVIAFNEGNGITILTSADLRNCISGNSIHHNDMIGIDLYPQGVTPNDIGDVDNGPNMGMNFPEIDTVIWLSGSSELVISGSLDTPDPDSCIIEIYKAYPNLCGYGEGMQYLSSVSADVSGNWADTLSGLNEYDFLCTLATDKDGNSSEFSIARSQFEYAGISEDEISIKVYPNPCEDFLVLESDYQGIFRITDMNGKTILESDYSGKAIDVSGLSTGNYILELFNGKVNNSIKFNKQ